MINITACHLKVLFVLLTAELSFTLLAAIYFFSPFLSTDVEHESQLQTSRKDVLGEKIKSNSFVFMTPFNLLLETLI